MSTADWIPVSERLPKRIGRGSKCSDDVLIWPRAEDTPPAAYYNHLHKQWYDASGFSIFGITHWAALPEGPTNPEVR